ncbi:MAG: AAA family ATPase [Dehalococcoidia bacterium]|nr:AAA family ATPase [Dehalococcoidia bacterium]
MRNVRTAAIPSVQGGSDLYPPLVRALLDPGAYSHPVQTVELVQTHISYIFLTGQDVYKVKKAVDFGFLDFTTLEKRRHYCQEELRLNRRLSPAAYKGVVEVTRHGDAYRVGAPGEVVEYAVHMAQLPRDRMLDALLRRDEATPDMVRRLAEKTVEFHRRAETDPEVARFGSPDAVRFNWRENLAQTEKYVGTTIAERQYRDMGAYATRFVDAQTPLLERRMAEGRVRDCHGDLHTAQVCFTNGIEVIDCIEFTPRFRCIDVASEVAFLAMDLDFNGRHDLSRLWVDTYVELSGDGELRELLPFYKCYLAYVRGKVASFQVDAPDVPPPARDKARETARRYFDLAHSYTQPLGRPAIFITTGLAGTGKTTLARDLARRLGVEVASSDVVRKEMASVPFTERHFDPFNRGLYRPEMTEKTYDALVERARHALKRGQSIILDASFREARHRRQAAAAADDAGAAFYVLEAVCPEPLALRRLERRLEQGASASDARAEIYEAQKRAFEPIAEADSVHHMVVDTSRPRGQVIDHVLRRLPLEALAGVKG